MKENSNNSLRERVFMSIREDILSGKLRENEELREIAIGESLGVSRTPVREAIRQLELEGLVHIIPNKGAYVTGITDKDVNDIYFIRSNLEGLCVKWATDHITKEQIDELEEIILLSRFHLEKLEKDQPEQVSNLDGRFHEILYKASNSRILEHLLSDFHKYVKMARTHSVCSAKRALKSIDEHEAILEAIKEKDGERASMLAQQHIENVMRHMHMEVTHQKKENGNEKD